MFNRIRNWFFEPITEEMHLMATTLAQLDTELQDLTTAINDLVADAEALINKINSGQDFTVEVTELTTEIADLKKAHADAQAVLNPTPTPPAA